ncbi:MAG: nucleotidyltransferase family protein [Bacteroidales bacterium]|nr:nucleotidyltransferase family protein [Bacteroidales bacterium]
MQAFIPAAGLGTRLLTLTEHRPKALVEVGGVPLLKIAIDNLARQGVTRIVINVHHFADMLIDYLQSHDWGVEVLVSNEKDKLLDTGGGLKKAAPLFKRDEPILIHNVDILSRINFHDLVELHQQEGNFVTLAVSIRDTSRFLLFADNGLLVGWNNRSTGETKWVDELVAKNRALAFSGIAVLEPGVLDVLPPCEIPYPIVPAYLNIAKEHRISYFIHSSSDWMDVGTPQSLKKAQSWFRFSQK